MFHAGVFHCCFQGLLRTLEITLIFSLCFARVSKVQFSNCTLIKDYIFRANLKR